MEYPTGFRNSGWPRLPDWVREKFWAAVDSGLSPTAAATVAGVSGATGRKWAQDAGYRSCNRHRGTRYSAEVRAVFWAAVRAGQSCAQAARVAGVSENAARQWLDQAGYVPRTCILGEVSLDPAATDRLMSFVERCHLEELLEAGHRPARAARLLGRDRATTGREIKKGTTGSGYRARVAQRVVEADRRRPKARKLQANPALLAEVLRRLRQRHSPEQIAGRLREDFPEDPEMWVSHETIWRCQMVCVRGVGS